MIINDLSDFTLPKLKVISSFAYFRSMYEQKFRFSKFFSSFVLMLKSQGFNNHTELILDSHLDFSKSSNHCFQVFCDRFHRIGGEYFTNMLPIIEMSEEFSVFLLILRNHKMSNKALNTLAKSFSFLEHKDSRQLSRVCIQEDPSSFCVLEKDTFVIEHIHKKNSFSSVGMSFSEEDLENFRSDQDFSFLAVSNLASEGLEQFTYGQFDFLLSDFRVFFEEIINAISEICSQKIRIKAKTLKVFIFCQEQALLKILSTFVRSGSTHVFSCANYYASFFISFLKNKDKFDIFIDISNYPQIGFCIRHR